MKLICNIEVFHRQSTLAPNVGRRKPQRSCLAIGRQSIKSEDIHLLLQTQTNKVGTKYKVFDYFIVNHHTYFFTLDLLYKFELQINKNVEKVFTKCLNDGKAAIRLIEPPVDINLQGDKLQIKSFLNVLQLCLNKKLDPAVLTLSNLTPKTLKAAPKTKIFIKQKSEYPVCEGFPRVTEELHIVDLQRKSFDRQILKLQSLRILDLSQNQITSIPTELGNLPNLQELNLSDNQLGKSPITKWTWMSGSKISRNLRLLNLSSNQVCNF